jgi:hypothetical protein
VFDCIEAADGRLRIIDAYGGVGGGLHMLAQAYGSQGAARDRLRPYLRRLGEMANGGRILFVHDPFTSPFPFPDDFFNLVQQFTQYGPFTDWVPDLQSQSAVRRKDDEIAPEIEQMGVFLDPLASRLRLKIAYCSATRVDQQSTEGMPQPMVLLSGYRERARQRPGSAILEPEAIGVVVFTGSGARFPDDFKEQKWFPVVNPPLLDRLFECRWLLPFLMRNSEHARLFTRWIPVGMGMRTGDEMMEWVRTLHPPNGFPLAVLKPSHTHLEPHARFLDRTALRALAARQAARRLPYHLAEELIEPRVSHSYEEIAGYRGKLLDNLLRTPGAEVHDHGDGTFHYSAPYPFLESTVGYLQEYVESAPIRSRRTGKFHHGGLRVVLFDRKIVSAIYRLDPEPDDGTFRDPSRVGAGRLYEAAPPEVEERLQAQLEPFVVEMERRFEARIGSVADLASLRREWTHAQTAVPETA